MDYKCYALLKEKKFEVIISFRRKIRYFVEEE